MTDTKRALREETDVGETYTTALRSSIQKKERGGFGAPVALRKRQTLKTGFVKCGACSYTAIFSFIVVDGNMKTALSQRPISRASNVKGSHSFCSN